MSAMEFHVKVDVAAEGGYLATCQPCAVFEGPRLYLDRIAPLSNATDGHGATALAACINALANAHFEDFTETVADDGR